MSLAIAVTRLPHAEGLPLPARASDGAAGLDLMAAIAPDGKLVIAPGHWLAVPTGLCMAIPPGFEGQVRPRSGLALKAGITVLNSPGTIDADYRGEVKVVLINHSPGDFVIERGMRIAQLVIAPVTLAHFAAVETLDSTGRAGGGFGSTGR